MRRAFGYEGCPIILAAKARPKTIEPVRKFKPRPQANFTLSVRVWRLRPLFRKAQFAVGNG